MTALSGGGFLIADVEGARVLKVDAGGTISTVAGTGGSGFSGEGGPATAAALVYPIGTSELPGGGFLITDGQQVRKVDAAGTISTVAGNGTEGFGGDGGLATMAMFHEPDAAAALPDGGFLIADTINNRIRQVFGTPPASPTPPGTPIPPAPTPPKVVPPSNAFKVGRVSVGKGGTIKIAITFPGPGKVTVAAKAGKVTYGRTTVKVKKQGKLTVTVKPGKKGKALRTKRLRRHQALKVRLTKTFTPTGGTARTRSSTKTIIKGKRHG